MPCSSGASEMRQLLADERVDWQVRGLARTEQRERLPHPFIDEAVERGRLRNFRANLALDELIDLARAALVGGEPEHRVDRDAEGIGEVTEFGRPRMAAPLNLPVGARFHLGTSGSLFSSPAACFAEAFEGGPPGSRHGPQYRSGDEFPS